MALGSADAYVEACYPVYFHASPRHAYPEGECGSGFRPSPFMTPEHPDDVKVRLPVPLSVRRLSEGG